MIYVYRDSILPVKYILEIRPIKIDSCIFKNGSCLLKGNFNILENKQTIAILNDVKVYNNANWNFDFSKAKKIIAYCSSYTFLHENKHIITQVSFVEY